MSVTHTLSYYLTLIEENYGIVIPPEVSEKIYYYVYHRGKIHCELVSYWNSLCVLGDDFNQYQQRHCQVARINSLVRAIKKHQLADFDDSDISESDYQEWIEQKNEDPKCYILGESNAGPRYPSDDQENFDLKSVCIEMIRNVQEYFEIDERYQQQFFYIPDYWIKSINFCSFILISESNYKSIKPSFKSILRDYEKEGMYPNLYNYGGWVKII